MTEIYSQPLDFLLSGNAAKNSSAKSIYSQQWDFWQGAAQAKQPECTYGT